jgi:hypothetical protein
MVFFKLVLVGRLENLVSDRRLVEHCALRLDVLWFLGDEVDEALPGHSTVSRTRQLFPGGRLRALVRPRLRPVRGPGPGRRRHAGRRLGPRQGQRVARWRARKTGGRDY